MTSAKISKFREKYVTFQFGVKVAMIMQIASKLSNTLPIFADISKNVEFLDENLEIGQKYILCFDMT